MRVVVEPYNPVWASQFASIRRNLQETLRSANVQYISIEHVGSTSVPSLAAKPHIDLDIVVVEDQVQSAIKALEDSGMYQNIGELGIPQRYALALIVPPVLDGVTIPRWNTYICVEGCLSLRNHLAVREVCKTDARLRDEYSRVKLELGKVDFEDISEYVVAKNEVIGKILAKAGMTGEVDAVKTINLEAAKH